jgi:endonuclease III
LASLDQDRLRHALAALESQYGKFEIRSGGMVDQILWAILARHGSAEKASKAVAALWKHFVDANELRVAQPSHIAEIIEECCGAHSLEVADRIRAFLKRTFEDHNALAFEFGKEMDREALRRYLVSLPGFGPELVLSVMLRLLPQDGELVPDPHAARVAARTGIAPQGTTGARFKKLLEDEIQEPGMRQRVLFALAAHGGAVCHTKSPACGECVLGRWCPSYAEPKAKRGKGGGEPASRHGGEASTPRTTRSRSRAASARKSSRR